MLQDNSRCFKIILIIIINYTYIDSNYMMHERRGRVCVYSPMPFVYACCHYHRLCHHLCPCLSSLTVPVPVSVVVVDRVRRCRHPPCLVHHRPRPCLCPSSSSSAAV